MLPDEVEITSKLRDLLSIIIQEARLNNVISNDEIKLINSVQENIDEFKNKLAKTSRQNLSIEEYNNIMKLVLNGILEDAIMVAKKDQVITEDEEKLLNTIRDFIYDTTS